MKSLLVKEIDQSYGRTENSTVVALETEDSHANNLMGTVKQSLEQTIVAIRAGNLVVVATKGPWLRSPAVLVPWIHVGYFGSEGPLLPSFPVLRYSEPP